MLVNIIQSKSTCLFVAIVLFSAVLAGCGGHKHGDSGHHDVGSDHHASGDGHHSDSSVGIPGSPDVVDRTITITMNDEMRFVPANIDVKAGETIRFDLTNAGAIKHEMVIGNAEYLLEHAEMMKKFPGMEHEEPNMLLLDPSASGELVWKFTQSGNVDFACLQPGHFDAGMKGIVSVAAES
jgi:uncharacterized cupredoxin-like copper-binding protein